MADSLKIPVLTSIAFSVAAFAVEPPPNLQLKQELVWSGDEVPLPGGGITSDGRYLVFADGDLYIRDLSAGKTEVRDLGNGWATNAKPSPDGSQIAFGYLEGQARQLRVVQRAAGNVQTLYDGTTTGSVHPLAWSKGGQEVLAWVGRSGGGGTLVAVPVPAGPPRQLREFPSGSVEAASISPDDALLAYAVNNEVRTLNLAESEDSPLFADPSGVKVVTWLQDGQSLLFLSNRDGSLGAWVVRVQQRKPGGAARLVIPKLERTDPVGIGPDGRVFVHITRGGVDTHLVAIDSATGLRVGTVSNLAGRLPGVRRHQAIWAPDSSRIAYVRSAPLRGAAVVVHDTSTGQTREYPVVARVIERPVWHPSGRRLAIVAEDANGQGVFEIDLMSGLIKKVLGPTNAVEYAKDGDHLIYRRARTTATANAIVKRHLVSGEETELYAGSGAFFTAPDGTSFLLYRRQTRSLWFAPAGLPERQLVSEIPDTAHEVALSSDGRYAYYVRTSPWEVWMVPTAGGTPAGLGVNLEGIDRVTAKPNGQGLLLSGGVASLEVWAWSGIR